jgi:hypothetical protein
MDNMFKLVEPNEQILEKMVMREEEIRMSQEYKQACTNVKDIPNGWLNVTKDVQVQVAKEFGFTDEINCEIACNRLRRAQYIYPNNKIFTSGPVYVRQNKARVGDLKEGDKLPNTTIYDGINEHNLHDITDDAKINIIFGASHS